MGFFLLLCCHFNLSFLYHSPLASSHSLSESRKMSKVPKVCADLEKRGKRKHSYASRWGRNGFPMMSPLLWPPPTTPEKPSLTPRPNKCQAAFPKSEQALGASIHPWDIRGCFLKEQVHEESDNLTLNLGQFSNERGTVIISGKDQDGWSPWKSLQALVPGSWRQLLVTLGSLPEH